MAQEAEQDDSVRVTQRGIVTSAASEIVAEFTSHKTIFTLAQSLPSVTDVAGPIETLLIADARAFVRLADSVADRIYAEEPIIWKGVAALLGIVEVVRLFNHRWRKPIGRS